MKDLLLDSWDRQSSMIDSLACLVDDEIRKVKPSEDGMPLDMQLAHIHEVRYGWLGQTSPEVQATIGNVLVQEGTAWRVIDSLDEVRAQLKISAQAVRNAAAQGLELGGKFGPYDHALFFVQHMIWHEGYHAALLLLGLRNAGREPDDAWEEKHIWELWRGPDVWN